MDFKPLLQLSKKNGVFTLVSASTLWFLTLIYNLLPEPNFQRILVILLILFAILFGMLVLRSRAPYLILSPFFILGVYALFVYILLPQFFIFIESFNSHPTYDVARAKSWIGSRAEMLVIQFAAFCFTLNALITKILAKEKKSIKFTENKQNSTNLFFGIVGIILILFFVEFLRSLFPTFNTLFSSSMGKQIGFSFEPIISICLAITTYMAARKKGRFTVILAILIFLYLGLKVTNVQVLEGKLNYSTVHMPFFICICNLTYYWVLNFKNFRKSIPTLSLIAIVVVSTFLSIGIFRYAMPSLPETKNASFFVTVKDGVIGKLFHRQINSAVCLKTIVNSRLTKKSGDHFYFLSAITPRALWSNKPNLSRGHEMHRFCWPEDKATYTELPTILGEPIFEGGWLGLITAQAFLGITLTFVMIFLMNGEPIRLIVLVGLLPYLGHFQQHFALYFANAVKMALFMVPVILFLIFVKSTFVKLQNIKMGEK